MSSYDLENLRLMCSERIDKFASDARPPAGSIRRRSRRRIRAALGKLASSPAAFRARVSLDS